MVSRALLVTNAYLVTKGNLKMSPNKNPNGNGSDEGDAPYEDADRERKNLDRYGGYNTEDGYVIYDTRNPSAWIKSSNKVEAEEKA